MTILTPTESALSNRLHSVPPAKRPESDDELRSIDDEALAGPDSPPPRRLTPEWVAVNLMDITAHLMAAIDKAAGPLERLADAAEDTTAHVAHASRFFRRPLTMATIVLAIGLAGFGIYALEARPHHSYSYESALADIDSSHVSLGGVTYPIDRKSFETRLAAAQPEAIRKYFVEISGRKFPVKQAVSVGLGAPRASFRTDAAIHTLTKMGYQTQEVPP
jgi:hypothetical protein